MCSILKLKIEYIMIRMRLRGLICIFKLDGNQEKFAKEIKILEEDTKNFKRKLISKLVELKLPK